MQCCEDKTVRKHHWKSHPDLTVLEASKNHNSCYQERCIFLNIWWPLILWNLKAMKVPTWNHWTWPGKLCASEPAMGGRLGRRETPSSLGYLNVHGSATASCPSSFNSLCVPWTGYSFMIQGWIESSLHCSSVDENTLKHSHKEKLEVFICKTEFCIWYMKAEG